MTTAYVDASALVKLIVERTGCPGRSGGFSKPLTSRSRVASGSWKRCVPLARAPVDAASSARILKPIAPVEFDAAIAATAAVLAPSSLRTLDAIHLATALALYHVDAFVTYDRRLAEAARAVGLTVASPA